MSTARKINPFDPRRYTTEFEIEGKHYFLATGPVVVEKKEVWESDIYPMPDGTPMSPRHAAGPFKHADEATASAAHDRLVAEWRPR